MESALEALSRSELLHLDLESDVEIEALPPEVAQTISQCFEDTARSHGSSTIGRSSPPPDSDSGDSLFLTQSVAPVVRTVRRHHSSERSACRFGLESDDESERGYNEGVSGLPRKRRPAYTRLNRTEFPFLQRIKKSSGRLSLRKNQILVNSEIGGFFKCVKKLSKNQMQREPCPSLVPSLLEEDCLEEGSIDEDHENNDDYDVRAVDIECFIFNAHKRNRKPWLPKEQWQTKLKMAKKKKNEQRKRSRKPKRSKDITGETGTSSTSSKTSRRKKQQKSSSSVARTSFTSPGDSSSRSFLMDHVEQSENQLDVLVPCSQSQFPTDQQFSSAHPAQQPAEYSQNVSDGESNNQRVIEETQNPVLDQASGEAKGTSASELVDYRSKESGEDGMYLENIPFRELQDDNHQDPGEDGMYLEKIPFRELQDDDHQDPGEDVSNQLQENEEVNIDSGVSICSQDLFEQEENETDAMIPSRSMDEIRVRDGNEDQGSCVVQCEERSPLRTENIVARQADLASETDSPLFNFGGLTFLKRRKRKNIESSKHPQSSYLDACQNDCLSSYDDSFGQNKRKKLGLLDNTGEESVESASSQLPLDAFQQSEPNVAAVATEEQSVQSLPHSREGTHVEDSGEERRVKDISPPTGIQSDDLIQPLNSSDAGDNRNDQGSRLNIQTDDLATPMNKENIMEHGVKCDDVAKDANQTKATEQIETLEVVRDCEQDIQLLCEKRKKKKKKRERGVVKNVDVELNRVETIEQVGTSDAVQGCEHLATEFVPEKSRKKMKRKREHDTEENVSFEASERIITSQSEENKLKKKKKTKQIVENNAGAEIAPIIKVVQDSEQQTTESVPEKKLKKKKKKEQVVENNADVDATVQIEPLDTVQPHWQQDTQFVPVKRKKKKKRHIEEDVSIEANEVETTMESEKKKMKKKKKEDVNNAAVEPTESITKVDSEQQIAASCSEKKMRRKKPKQSEALDVVQHHHQQASKLVPEKRKKKIRKSELNIEENITVDAIETETTIQIEKKKLKKKKKRDQVVEHNLGVEACPVQPIEQRETLDIVQHHQQQASELVPVKKVKKKKRHRVVEESMSVESACTESTQQIEDHVVIQEQVAGEVAPRKNLKKKKKRLQLVDDNVDAEATQRATVDHVETLGSIQKTRQQSSELGPERKKKKKKSDDVKETLPVDASQTETTEQAPDLIQGFEQDAGKRVPKKKLKTKKKRAQVEKNGDVDATQVSTADHIESQQRIQETEQQSTEMGPDIKVKEKKKKKTSDDVKENMAVDASQAPDQIQGFEQDTGKQVLKKKLKTKKKRAQVEENVDVDATQLSTAEHVESQQKIQETEQQSTEMGPDIKVKKKKKKSDDVKETLPVDASQTETTEQAPDLIQGFEQDTGKRVPKKKLKTKKKRAQVEKNGDVDATQVSTADHIESQQRIQETEQQCTEMGPDIKVKKKKKKTSDDVKETLPVDASQTETTEQAPDLIQGFELEAGKYVSKTKLKKKKRVQVVNGNGQVETTKHVKALEMIQGELEKAGEPVPKTKLKKKKRAPAVNGNGQVETTKHVKALEMIQGELEKAGEPVPKTKLKVKRALAVNGNGQGETTKHVKALEMIQGELEKAGEPVPKTKLRKKKRVQAVNGNGQVETTKHDKALEMIQGELEKAGEPVPKTKLKKKKKRVHESEENVNVETTPLASADRVKTLEKIDETQQQSTELVAEMKLKKKKKKLASQIVTEQVETLELIHDSKQVAVELVPEKKKLKKKKNKAA